MPSYVEIEFGLRDADEHLGSLYLDAVAKRDAEALNRLIITDHPDILWGKYFKQLSEEDRDWAMQNTRTS